ncbi:pilin [Pseudomonas sp. HS-18]|uniref:pilin n=1 Tax=Pseudomonas sp. HS-18 TaxID=2879114 RepID=UPI001CF08260|nr:pilin [Pseudomonas sp. HS-18]UCL88103.1 pilin [Pseudomonas sp. HS-18]
MKAQKGFTLIELMIVVAIIGILAAIALPAYQDYMGRSQMTEAMTLASGAKTSVAEYYSNNGHFPTNNQSAGLAVATDIKGKYVTQVAQSAGVITATMASSGVAKGVEGLTLILSPVTNNGSLSWKCKGSGSAAAATAKYYPSSCR